MGFSDLPACDAPLYEWNECQDEQVAVVGGGLQGLAVLELGLDPGAGAGVGTAARDAT